MDPRVANLHAVVENISAALAAPETTWERVEDTVKPTDHFVGNHPTWLFHVLCTPTHGSMGTAMNIKEGLVVKLTPSQTQAAEAAARSLK